MHGRAGLRSRRLGGIAESERVHGQGPGRGVSLEERSTQGARRSSAMFAHSRDALVVGERTLAPGLPERRLASERLRHVPPTCPAVHVGLAAVQDGVKSASPGTPVS